MKIEHLTLGGNSTLRDSSTILMETVNLLKDFQIRKGVKTLLFPKTEFHVKVTATEEGAIFDVMKGNDIGVMNVCCFGENKDLLVDIVRSMSNNTLGTRIIREPDSDLFIYSVLINPFIMSKEDLMIAGEVEFYIYYSLYLARTKPPQT